MEILSPEPYLNWLLEESSKWTQEENKLFESALAVYDKETPDRWLKVASMIPGKSVVDVIRQYQDLEADVCNIEAGLIPIPGYSCNSPPFTLDYWANHYHHHHHHRNHNGFNQSYGAGGKRSPSVTSRPSDQDRKKGVPWTEDEHKLFLRGLNKYGKGDWRNISRNFVITRTPTQVASHAQKYFIRQLSGSKDKRRASIHDITTVNLSETHAHSPENEKTPLSPDHSTVIQHLQNQNPNPGFQWSHHDHNNNNNNNNNDEAISSMRFNGSQGNIYPYGIKTENDFHEASYIGPQIMGFQMQQHYSLG